MIRTEEEYKRTKEYVNKLEAILLDARRNTEPTEYELMSRSFVRSIAKAQRDMMVYLAGPVAS
jgi:hypothetical protein